MGTAIDALADEFRLSPEERLQLIPSGRQPVFYNRVPWAGTYLRKAVLLEATGRGRFRITERGRQVLATNPPRIDLGMLNQFSEFREFRKRTVTVLALKPAFGPGQPAPEADARSPREVLEATYLEMRRVIEQELVERAKAGTPARFEQMVLDLLVAMDYGGSALDASRVGRSGDGGIDGIIQEDKLGLDAVYVQAKRWTGTVPIAEVRAFSGSLDAHRARKGVLITTSSFPAEAERYVASIEKKLVLIDGDRLGSLMFDYGIGVADEVTYPVKRVDTGYFEEV